uniref:GYF domain-containing protein n=1 Tax=Araucaria cunninghamii TaxID=56994 RepID=A0A0D6R305_ARACU
MGNRENSYDARRESKWDTRWGREDKDLENRREKWLEPGKDGEGQREKGVPIVSDNSKETERESENNPRPWRSNSLQNRARGETPHLSTPTPNKQAQGFAYGRGRGDMSSSGFTSSRGRGNYSGSSLISNLSNNSSLGAASERWDTNMGNGSTLKYSRAKLLDIYRKCVMKPSFARPPDGFTEIPLLTQTEALEPLALSSPSQEEEAIIEGIMRGDIVSSGAPQYSKDGAVNRNRDDVVHSQRQRPGSRGEENPINSKVNNYNHKETDIFDKNVEFFSRDLKIGESREWQHLQDSSTNVEGFKDEELRHKHRDDLTKSYRDCSDDSSAPISGTQRLHARTEELHGPSYDWQEIKSEISTQGSEAKDPVWPRSVVSRDHSNHERNIPGTGVSREDGMGWPRMLVGEGDCVERDKAGTREVLRHIPPEELSLFYKDPQGDIQGPFSGADMIGWFEAGYFGIDLPVRLQSAPGDVPFTCLGDVMPHLRMKARAPPGFGTPKLGDVTDTTNANKFGSHGKVQANIIGSGFELPKNEQKGTKETLAAEKSFIESLMSRTFKSPQPVESVEGGLHGFPGLSPGGTQSIGAEIGLDMNYAIGQRMAPYHSVERQKSLPNHFPYLWSAGDVSPLATNSETITDTSKLTTMTSGGSHTISHNNQHGDVMSILHGAVESTAVSPMNKAVKSWANYGDVQSRGNLGHSGLDIPHQDQLDVHQLQRFSPVQSGFSLQHQRQQQHQPLMQHLMSPSLENHSGAVPLEQLLPSGLPPDPQTLNLIHQQQQQQQLLLSQLRLHSQASLPSQVSLSQASLPSQVSLLDQLLMLQQQKQQQQQQLLPQVLLEQITQQHLQEPSYDRAQASGSLGNASPDHLMFRQPNDTFMNNANAKLPQHAPFPQTSMVDNIGHLLNQQVPKGTDLSQPSQLKENFKVNQLASVIPQQTTAGEIHPSPVWGVTEQDSLTKLQASSFFPSCEILEKVSNEQQMLLQLGKDDAEQIPTDSLSPRKVDDVILTENNMVTTKLLANSVSDPSVGHTGEHVILEKTPNQNELKLKDTVTMAAESSTFQEKHVGEDATVRETNVTETREVRKSTERKSRKQKNNKTLSERQKGQSEVNNRQQMKQEDENAREVTQSLPSEDISSDVQIPFLQSTVSQNLHAPISVSGPGESLMVDQTLVADVDSLTQNLGTSSLAQRAWKPAPCPKPKSLLEIQQEEKQQKAKSERVISEVPVLSSPTTLPMTGSNVWAGPAMGSEKLPRDIQHDMTNASASVLRSVSGNSDIGSSVGTKKSQLHDLLAEEVLAKSSPQIPEPTVIVNVEKPPALLPTSVALLSSEVSPGDDNEFVEAKETKKSRKRATKGKNTAAGKTNLAASLEPSVPSIPVEKSKNSRQVQQDKEVFPVPPSGPSLGDFLPWKAESSSSPPAPAWSLDAAKLTKTASLREIQKEQERKLAMSVQPQQVIAAPKVPASRSTSGNSTLWSSAKTTPSQSIAIPSSSLRTKPEDELFWGPVNQLKQETDQPGFPSLVTNKSLTPKSSMGKTSFGSSSRQSSVGLTANKSSDLSLSSSAKGKKQQLVSKHSEAKDFYDWCESELCKLIGNNDTYFLEYCMKLSTSEAEMLLVENLGLFDPEREFIDKVLKYKELLPADVIEMAFSYRDVHVQTGTNMLTQDANTRDSKLKSGRDTDTIGVANDLDISAKGGKKKGKKGKKMSPAVLGFSVESTTRRNKGEIQTLDD